MWALGCSQGFFLWFDLVAYFLTFELVQDFVKDIIVSKFEVDWAENVDCKVFTRLFYALI